MHRHPPALGTPARSALECRAPACRERGSASVTLLEAAPRMPWATACSYRSRAWGGLPGAAASAPRSPAASSPRSYPCDGPAPHRPVSEAACAHGIRCQLGEQNTDTSPFSTFEVFEARIKHAPHHPSVLHPSVERLRAEPASLAELLCFCPLRHQALFLLLSFLPHLSERSDEPNIRRTRFRPCMQGEETLSVRAGHGGKRGARILTQQSKN